MATGATRTPDNCLKGFEEIEGTTETTTGSAAVPSSATTTVEVFSDDE